MSVPSVARLVLGRGGHGYIRRAHVALISLAFAIIAVQLADAGGPGAGLPGAGLAGAGLAGQPNLWALPAIAAAAAAGAMLVIVSGSPASLEVLRTLGLPEISAARRARANGLVWAGVGLLMVHFTAPAFEPVPGGPVIVGLVFALGLGVGTMRLHRAAIDHEAYRSFNLVALLLAAGSLASMSITPTGEWWVHNFSTLGTSDDIAAACFNIAITMSGLGMALLGPALSGALRSERFRLRRGGLTAVRVLIAFIGVSLMGVGIVPIDRATDLHNLFACGAAAGFAVLALGVQLWARRMPRTLVVFSYAALAVEIAAMIAYDGLKVFNLTVFEIVAFTLVFAWLIVLVAVTGPAALGEPAGPDALTSVAAEPPARHLVPHRVRRQAGARTPATRSAGHARRSRAPVTVGRAGRRRTLAAVPDEPPDRRSPQTSRPSLVGALDGARRTVE
ncbi:hypothetical protein [Agromyces aerolatus]|uniref:hypothetical protein n=1 Tax=Agromyces sp. LY-1074 TaxID=3074080 RepID=UPI002857858F|nr:MULTISPECIES: hypothetical protein [unclassified Agromyces]MDR5701925.1 hypothetical protein [Agromyces sp. LY-1074]MDR5708151.1 hypothetical protein [Agromyces sp. LY-1358]